MIEGIIVGVFIVMLNSLSFYLGYKYGLTKTTKDNELSKEEVDFMKALTNVLTYDGTFKRGDE